MSENKIALLYYSRTDNTKMLAEFFKEKFKEKNIEIDLIRLHAKKRPSFFKAISSARNQEELAVRNDLDLSSYNTLIFAMPSWAYYPAPFYKTILKNQSDLDSKQIAIILCAGVSIKRNIITMQRFKDELESIGISSIADLIIIVRKKEIIDGTQELDAFINKLSTNQIHTKQF